MHARNAAPMHLLAGMHRLEAAHQGTIPSGYEVDRRVPQAHLGARRHAPDHAPTRSVDVVVVPQTSCTAQPLMQEHMRLFENLLH